MTPEAQKELNRLEDSETVHDSASRRLTQAALSAAGQALIDATARIAKLENVLGIAEATIRRLERHAPGSANGTLDLISAALEKTK